MPDPGGLRNSLRVRDPGLNRRAETLVEDSKALLQKQDKIIELLDINDAENIIRARRDLRKIPKLQASHCRDHCSVIMHHLSLIERTLAHQQPSLDKTNELLQLVEKRLADQQPNNDKMVQLLMRMDVHGEITAQHLATLIKDMSYSQVGAYPWFLKQSSLLSDISTKLSALAPQDPSLIPWYVNQAAQLDKVLKTLDSMATNQEAEHIQTLSAFGAASSRIEHATDKVGAKVGALTTQALALSQTRNTLLKELFVNPTNGRSNFTSIRNGELQSVADTLRITQEHSENLYDVMRGYADRLIDKTLAPVWRLLVKQS